MGLRRGVRVLRRLPVLLVTYDCRHPAVSQTDRFTSAGLTTLGYRCDVCLQSAVLYRLPDETPAPDEILAELARRPGVVDGVRY